VPVHDSSGASSGVLTRPTQTCLTPFGTHDHSPWPRHLIAFGPDTEVSSSTAEYGRPPTTNRCARPDTGTNWIRPSRSYTCTPLLRNGPDQLHCTVRASRLPGSAPVHSLASSSSPGQLLPSNPSANPPPLPIQSRARPRNPNPPRHAPRAWHPWADRAAEGSPDPELGFVFGRWSGTASRTAPARRRRRRDSPGRVQGMDPAAGCSRSRLKGCCARPGRAGWLSPTRSSPTVPSSTSTAVSRRLRGTALRRCSAGTGWCSSAAMFFHFGSLEAIWVELRGFIPHSVERNLPLFSSMRHIGLGSCAVLHLIVNETRS
jgi:hypothetical protein